MEYAAAIAAVAGLVTQFLAAGKEEEAQKLRDKMAAEYGPESLPDLDKAIAQTSESQFNGLSENPQGRQMQMGVDQELADIYDNAGTTKADQAAYDVASRRVSQRAAADAGDIGIEAARRGQTGGPLGSILAAQSGQNELEALAGLNSQVASDARGRALQALLARGQNAGRMRDQDWNVASTRASAMDLQNRFNASQRQQTEMRNAGLSQQQFDNNMARLNGLTGARNGQVAGLNQQANGIRQTGAGVANAAMSYGSSWDDSQDPTKKK